MGLFLLPQSVLDRKGIEAKIPFACSATKTKNGVEEVVPNCFQCHDGYVDERFVIDLGNTFAAFTLGQSRLTYRLMQQKVCNTISV